MSWVSAGIASGAATQSLVQAYIQHKKAKELSKTQRPQYDIPQSEKDALANAKYVAGMTQLPGQNIMQQNLDSQSARAVSNLKDVSPNNAALGSNIGKIYRGNVEGQNQLGIMAAQNWLNNQGNLRGQQGQFAQYQDKKWDINQFQPYQNNMAAASALKYASNMNLNNASNQIAQGYANYAMMSGGNKGTSPMTYTEVASTGNQPLSKPGAGYDVNPISSGDNTQYDSATIKALQDFVKQHPELFNY